MTALPSNRLRPVVRVTIYCPLRPDTFAALARGELDAVASDPDAGPVLRIIAGSTDLGNFGSYRGVCEIGLGIEAFTPGEGAVPTLGGVGTRTLSATAQITTYVPAGLAPGRLDALVAALAAAHPWEIPVIEVAEISVFGRPPGS
jgi:hypothetical protein